MREKQFGRRKNKQNHLSKMIAKNLDDPVRLANMLEASGVEPADDPVSNRKEMMTELELIKKVDSMFKNNKPNVTQFYKEQRKIMHQYKFSSSGREDIKMRT